MNAPTLPTDNLYKFIAIGGLTIAIASFYIPYQVHHESQKEELELEKIIMRARDAMTDTDARALGLALLKTFPESETQGSETDISEKYMRSKAQMEILRKSSKGRTPYYTTDDGERQVLFIAMRTHVTLCNLVIENYAPVVMNGILERADLRDSLQYHHSVLDHTLNELSEDEKTQFVKDQIEVHRLRRSTINEGMFSSIRYWSLIDSDTSISFWWHWFGYPIGGLSTIVGFYLWYVRIQRHQDRQLAESDTTSSEPPVEH